MAPSTKRTASTINPYIELNYEELFLTAAKKNTGSRL